MLAALLILVAASVPGAGVLRAQVTPLAQAAATYTVSGTVVNHDGQPLSGADVGLVVDDSVSRRVRSDTAGHFEMAGLASSSATLRVRRFGFAPRNVRVTIPEAAHRTSIVIELDVSAAQLAGVSVTEDSADDEMDEHLRDFYARKANNSFGRYVEGSAIEKRRPQFVSEMLRTMPGVSVTPGTRIGYTVRIRGCSPLVWLDGVRVPGAQLDEVARPADVAGIEIYNSFAGIPAQYFDRSATCGTVLVWTRAK